MRYDVTDYQFSDLATFSYGKMPKKSKIKANGKYPIYSGYRYVGYYDEYNIEPRQLIVVARGVGGTGDVKITTEKCYLTNLSIAVKITETEKVLPEYLYYLFKLNNLRYLDSGSAQSQITINDLGKVHIDLPSINWQKKIVNLLLTIDDKIATNTAINKNLESQAQAIFKSWFVDFEPFGGEMPRDWRIGNAGEILEFHDAKRVPLSGSEREKMDKIYPYYGASSLMDYVDNYIFEGIYLLLGEDGTVITKEGFPVLQYIDGKFWVNNHAHILTGKLGFSVEELYLLFSITNIKSIVTGAVQPKVSQTNLKKLSVVIPSTYILKEFDGVVQPLFEDIRYRRVENERLTVIRDTLLPRLMSGEIDVGNVEV